MINLLNKSNSRGFSLVEAMVSLVVLSIGMLGIASLFIVSFKSSATAINRLNAVNLAAELADRIRANRFAGAAYAGAGANGACSGTTVKCSAVEMAAYDLYGWRDAVSKALPGSPTATVAVTPSGGSTATYTIEIKWSEVNQPDLSYELQTRI